MGVPTPTRQRMIQTAARLFQRDGYHATSWRGLVEEAGTPWGSVHHHFPGGKEELGVAAVDAGADAVTALIGHCFAQAPDPSSAIALWFTLSGELLVNSDYATGCPVATVALETSWTSPPLRAATHRAFRQWRDLIAAELRLAGTPSGEARDAAEVVLALLEGALLLARAQETDRPLRIAAGHAVAVVRSSAP